MKRILFIFITFAFILPAYSADENFATTILKTQIERTQIKNGSNLMLKAIIDNDIESAHKLLRLGYNANESYSKVPATFFAIYLSRNEILDLLLDYGADPNATYFKVSLLDFSIYLNKPDCVSKLIKYGVDVNKKSLSDVALNFAIVENQSEIVQMLIEAGAVPNKRTYRLLKSKKYESFRALVPEK